MKPNPGSEEAIKLGCNCPVIDNARGKGAWGTLNSPQEKKMFFIRDNCSLHGVGAEDEKEADDKTECGACNGTGLWFNQDCGKCSGWGTIPKEVKDDSS